MTRRIDASWTYDYHINDFTEPPVDISALTVDEQADLIIKKLTEPPKQKRTVEDMIAESLAALIADAIDKDILQALTKGSK